MLDTNMADEDQPARQSVIGVPLNTNMADQDQPAQ
jgi:hypothetical protein